MADFGYPTNAQLQLIAQDKLPNLTRNRPIFDIMPIVEVDDSLLVWEQMDNFTGLQQVRGLNGQPSRVKKTGAKRYQVEPGVYGEFEAIDEQELTRRRQFGSFATAINIDDLVMVAQDKLLQRRYDRMEYIGWTLLSTGTFAVPAPNGSVLHTDSYSQQTYASAVPWATVATATPLADLRAVQLLSRGHSVDFGAGAIAYFTRVTANRLLSNNNSADLYGRRTQGLGIINSLADANRLFAGDDLPTFQINDQGYIDDTGVFRTFIPDGKVIIVGRRPNNAPVMDYAMTRNANNANLAPGPYMMVEDNAMLNRPPREINVHDGHNGGPRMYFPSAIVAMSV